MNRRLTAILFYDVVGYSRSMHKNEAATINAIKAIRKAIIDPHAELYNGRTIQVLGDGGFMEFASVVDATRFAIAMQTAVTKRNTGLPEEQRLVFRIGINIGDVGVDGDLIYGDGVNIAARLEGLSQPGGISVHQTVRDQVLGKLDLDYDDLGKKTLKNIEQPVRVYRVMLNNKAEAVLAKPAGLSSVPQRRQRTQLTLAGIASIIVIVFAAVWWQPWSPRIELASVERIVLPLPDKPSIAVLPFANMSGDIEQEYFADGMTEDIITDLSDFGLFFVISRNSSFAYKGVSVNVKDVARELGVQYILEGSVRKSGDRLRITVQFIDALADKHIWAERYDRKLEDVFQVQDEITQSIVTSVAPEYLYAELQRAQRVEARNLDAWDAFMRGYWHLLRFTKDDNANAQRFLRKAIDLEPNRANSHGVLAVTYLMDGFYGWSESRDVSFRRALESAERALALDSQDSQALRSIGLVHFFSKNHDVALSYYERAVAANPLEAENRALLGAALGVAGDYNAALEQFETAFRLSPRDVHIATWYGYLAVAAFVVGQDEEAADWARKAVETNPQFPGGHRTLAASAGNLGQIAEAATAREKLQNLQPHLTIAQLQESLPYFKNTDDLERYLDGLRKAGLPEGATE